jgi:hypothetical protein
MRGIDGLRGAVRGMWDPRDPQAVERRRQRRVTKALRWGYLAGGARGPRGDAERRSSGDSTSYPS